MKAAKTSACIDPDPLSPESIELAQAALVALKQFGSEELSKMSSVLETPPEKKPLPEEKAKRAPRVRRADLRLWDAVFELDEPAARAAFDDGAPPSVQRSEKLLFDRFLDGIKREASAQDQPAGQPGSGQAALEPQPASAPQDFEAKVKAMGFLLDQRGCRMTGIDWPHRGLDDKELSVEPVSPLGREQAIKKWRGPWIGYPEALRKTLTQIAIGWSAENNPGRLSIERSIDHAVKFNEGYRWSEPLALAGDLVEASGFSMTPSQWRSVERTLDLHCDPTHAPVLMQLLAPRQSPLSPELGRACSEAAIQADHAELLARTASLNGLSAMALYGPHGRREAIPTLLWALASHPKKKKADGSILGRDCFELLAKIPEMTERARTSFKASTLTQCDGEEALSLFARFPFMAGVDADGQNIAHAWSRGRFLSILSFHQLKKLLHGGFSALLSQPDSSGKTPIDLIKMAYATPALKSAIEDWSETYAKWEKKEMISEAPAQRSISKAKNAVRKGL